MDFQNLSRKELQALCKLNKIPANITNVAMADALQNLQTVEGLDEILNQSQIDHPVSPGGQKTDSLEIPQSTTRTTTRRKPRIEEPQTEQLGTRSRRAPRREINKEIDQVDTSVYLLETPAMPTTRIRATAVSASQKSRIQMKKDEDVENHDIKTPAVQNCSTKRPAVPSRRKVVETLNEGSVQRAYSTRRSVKLLENCMNGLSLQENIIEKPVEVDGLVKEADVSEGKELETNLQTSTEKESVKTTCPEPFIGRNLGESMEDEIDLEENYKIEEQTGSYKLADQSIVELEDSNQTEKIDEHAMDVVEDLIHNVTDTNDDFVVDQNLKLDQEDGNLVDLEGVRDESVEDLAPVDQICDTMTPEADGEKESDNASIDAVESMKMEVESADEPINEFTSPFNNSPTTVKGVSHAPAGTLPDGNQLSPYVEKSFSVQFPRPTLSHTRSSPLAIQELTHVTNINKENMDSSEMMVEQTKNIVMKKNNIDEDSLKNISMRKLIKMVKDMEISTKRKNGEDKVVDKVGKSRQALQMLPENRMHVGEQEK